MTTKLDPYQSLGFQCNLTVKAFIANLGEKLQGTGITPTQHRALAHLIALGPLSQSELVERLSITPATGVRLVDRMERDGWVRRQSDPEDGRKKQVVTTEKALQVWETASLAGREVLQKAYQGISEHDIETTLRVLAQVRKNLGE